VDLGGLDTVPRPSPYLKSRGGQSAYPCRSLRRHRQGRPQGGDPLGRRPWQTCKGRLAS